MTEGMGIDDLEKAYAHVTRIVYKHSANATKAELLEELRASPPPRARAALQA